MTCGHSGCVPFLICLMLITICATGATGGDELVLPEEVFFYYPVASVFGQNAVWINPAGPASGQGGSMVLFSQRKNRVIRDWGVAATMKVLGVAYRHIDNGHLTDHNEYILAIGGGRQTRFGLSYRYIKDGIDYLDDRHLWNMAILMQRTPNFSIGGRAENLNRGRIDGKRSDIRFVYGVAARSDRDLVTVSFDVDMTHRQSLNDAHFHTGVEVRPRPGMYLYFDFDNHSRFNFGFRLNFGKEYVGHYHNFNRHGKSYRATTYIGSVKGKQPSLTKAGRKSLMIRLDGKLPENPQIPFFGKKPLRFFDYVDGIYRAGDDHEVDKIFFRIGTLKCGLGKVEELSRAVDYCRSRGKKVFAYIDTPNNLGYLLASAADTIIIPPVSQLNLIGLHANLISLKGLMDKVGVEAEIERVEEYKTAPERYMFDRPTEPNRQQLNRILDNLYDEMVAAIAAGRNMSSDSVTALIDRGPLTSVEAVQYGLVDELLYLDEAVESHTAANSLWEKRQIPFYAYATQRVHRDRWGEPPQVALIIADGDISEGRSGGKVGDYEMLGTFRKVRDDDQIKGVVLRVNSPGGSALASDLIWHEVEKTRKKKPVVVSMGNVAASGGYYISSIDSDILVNRNTLTGSIGVYGGKANISELLDNIGIYTESSSRGKNAAMYSLYEPFTDEQRRQLKDQLHKFYRHFTEKVGQVRSLSADSVNTLGQGRVWTGLEAIVNGLADRIGGVHQAVEAICDGMGVLREDAEIVSYPYERYYFKFPRPMSWIWDLATGWLSGQEESLAVTDLIDGDHIFYRMPYNIEIE